MKPKINFKEYEPIDKLDDEETKLWESLQSDDYKSIMTEELRTYYAHVFTKSAKSDQSSVIHLTQNDKLLAKTRAKEEGLSYQTLLASIIHKWLHGRLVEVTNK